MIERLVMWWRRRYVCSRRGHDQNPMGTGCYKCHAMLPDGIRISYR